MIGLAGKGTDAKPLGARRCRGAFGSDHCRSTVVTTRPNEVSLRLPGPLHSSSRPPLARNSRLSALDMLVGIHPKHSSRTTVDLSSVDHHCKLAGKQYIPAVLGRSMNTRRRINRVSPHSRSTGFNIHHRACGCHFRPISPLPYNYRCCPRRSQCEEREWVSI